LTASASDGRRARGEARRRQLVDAALAVIERDGIAGLTHRAVAEAAGVSLASTSYHFAGIDDLLMTALWRATDDLADALRAEAADPSLAGLARFLADEAGFHRDLCIAEYELYLVAARRPEFAGAALAWLDVVADHFAPALKGAERRAFQATIDGVCLHALVRPERRDAEAIEGTLRAIWPDLP
jgi:DNA-binding transcriptional regulator YbjK